MRILRIHVDHLAILIECEMVTLLFIIFLGCSAVAKERSEKCDRVQFTVDDQNGISTHQNFTKQSFEKNGKPVYYTFSETANNQLQTIVWWDNENNTWLSKSSIENDTRPNLNSSKYQVLSGAK